MTDPENIEFMKKKDHIEFHKKEKEKDRWKGGGRYKF